MTVSDLSQGFAPVARPDARLLILGSMPSQASLAKQQYYAHQRNAFWHIMARLCDFSLEQSYAEKLLALQQHRLALWDVIHSCQRHGSLDSRIQPASIVANDFAQFFAEHPQLQHIFFNGACAEREYRKRVLPTLDLPWRALPTTRLPSTSPAMASLTLAQKWMVWEEILKYAAFDLLAEEPQS